MRWPVRGKVISGFGPKTNGLKNEGINIAVPEGTSVRAAEGGVVAYSGNELKGYGNLVLIRHDSGYVTAYAHAKELFVKRGDTVKRGDVIAKAGQTGSVSSPQLHFEVRKGATALDPMKFLSSATASN
jgi:murein DD-endopeptidase MepM/ murein hydrolase activator NlpD